MEPVNITQADLDAAAHQQAVVELLDLYSRDRMGAGAPLLEATTRDLLAGLQACPTSVLFLAYADELPVGLAVCFSGFSTFAARPLLNIHDLIVRPAQRRSGVATQLLAHIEHYARESGYCKITLEVRRDNSAAQALYRKRGIAPGHPPYEFWTKEFDECRAARSLKVSGNSQPPT
jgi:ribosomal protein S18 acetylase RimI-like enzyme